MDPARKIIGGGKVLVLKQAGMETVVLAVNFGWHGAMRKYLPQKIAGQPYPIRTFWNGRDSYDRESVREVINLVSSSIPRLY